VPEFETRFAILRQKCQEHGEIIEREVLEFIAANFTGSVRDMIGILINAIALSKLDNTTPTIRSVAEIMGKLNKTSQFVGLKVDLQKHSVRTLEDVIKVVSDYYKIDRNTLTGEERRREIIIPRQICMYLIREILDQSYETIGENFGGRNHTTVLHSCNKIINQLKDDNRLIRDINALKREMGIS